MPAAARDPGPQAVRPDDEPGRDCVRRSSMCSVALSGANDSDATVHGGEQSHPRRVHGGHQRGAQRALLDDPRQRALAQLVRRKVERRTRVTLDMHRFDRGDAIAGQRLPCAVRAQERRRCPG